MASLADQNVVLTLQFARRSQRDAHAELFDYRAGYESTVESARAHAAAEAAEAALRRDYTENFRKEPRRSFLPAE